MVDLVVSKSKLEVKVRVPEVAFKNQSNPNSYFEIVRIEELLHRPLDHNIFKNHLVQFYVIFFVYEGQGYHTIDFTDYGYGAGTVLLIRKDQIHKFFMSPNVKGYLLVFTEEFIIGHLNRMEALKSMHLFNDALSFPKVILADQEESNELSGLIGHMEVEYEQMDDFSIGITRSLLHVVITRLFRIKAQGHHYVGAKKYAAQFLEFQTLVEQHCLKTRQVQYYARELGVSAKTLNNITRDVVNVSAKSFIDERAIMQIKRLLISTELSIKEVAYAAGFSDSTNFYKYFKKFVQSAPEVFRKAH